MLDVVSDGIKKYGERETDADSFAVGDVVH
jgi:hypothetical protein